MVGSEAARLVPPVLPPHHDLPPGVETDHLPHGKIPTVHARYVKVPPCYTMVHQHLNEFSLDFCYFMNFSLVVQIFLFKSNIGWFKVRLDNKFSVIIDGAMTPVTSGQLYPVHETADARLPQLQPLTERGLQPIPRPLHHLAARLPGPH